MTYNGAEFLRRSRICYFDSICICFTYVQKLIDFLPVFAKLQLIVRSRILLLRGSARSPFGCLLGQSFFNMLGYFFRKTDKFFDLFYIKNSLFLVIFCGDFLWHKFYFNRSSSSHDSSADLLSTICSFWFRLLAVMRMTFVMILSPKITLLVFLRYFSIF